MRFWISLAAGPWASCTGRQQRLDRIVALKTVDLHRLGGGRVAARGELEAKVVARLSHPNIVTAYDYGVQEGKLYLAMELLDGETLQNRIDRAGPLEERLAWAIARQIAAGLAHAAEHNIVHRDIKPANVILTKALPGMETPPGVPRAKITDFGLAIQINNGEPARLTACGAMVGTVVYSAPEQINDADVDTRADIFALGATTYHMMTGEPPFANATSVASVVAAKLAGNEVWRDELSADLAPPTVELLRAMTIPNRSERLGDYSLLIQRMDAILKAQWPAPRLAGLQNDGGSRLRRNPLSETLDLPKPNKPRRLRSRLTSAGENRLSTSAGDSRRQLQSSRKLVVLATACLVAAAVAIALLARSQSAGPNRSQIAVRDLVPSDKRQSLFNGQSVPIGMQAGSWRVTKDRDGGLVLAGTDGWLDLTLPAQSSYGPPRYYVLRLGVNPLDASEAELQFGATASRAALGSRYVVKLAGEVAQVGRCADMDGPFEALEGVEPVHLHRGADDSPVYQTIQVQRQPSGWFVEVNGATMASALDLSLQDAPDVRLMVRNGTGHFADLEVSDLIKPSAGSQ